MSDSTVEYEADKVVDEATFTSFLEFLQQYEADLQQINRTTSPLKNQVHYPKLWEHNSTSNFLQALVDWSSQSRNGDAYYHLPSNPWTRFAHLILAGLFGET